MKTLNQFIVGLLSLLTVIQTTTQASQLPSGFLFYSEITQMEIDPKLYFAGDVDGGRLTVNLNENTASLVLFRKHNCPEGAICAAMVPSPEVITLPIVKQYTNRCGVHVYKAKRDARRVDGALETLEIRDYVNNRCHDYFYVPPKGLTEIIYQTSHFDRLERKEIKTYSSFQGTELVDISRPTPMHN